MDVRVAMVVIDCADPLALSDFWAKATGYSVDHADEEWVTLREAGGGSGIPLGLQRVPEAKAGKNRVHVDLHTDDEEREAQRIEADLTGRVARNVSRIFWSNSTFTLRYRSRTASFFRAQPRQAFPTPADRETAARKG